MGHLRRFRDVRVESAFPLIATDADLLDRQQCADIVAKVGEGHLRRNNRIGATNSLNQHCVSALDLESILLVWVRKILLQQYQGQSRRGLGDAGQPLMTLAV
jgi:hypothetical protein